MIGAGDRQDDVREEGKAGLRPPRLHEQAQIGKHVCARIGFLYFEILKIETHICSTIVYYIYPVNVFLVCFGVRKAPIVWPQFDELVRYV